MTVHLSPNVHAFPITAPYTHVDTCHDCGAAEFDLRLLAGRAVCPECHARDTALAWQSLPLIKNGTASPVQLYRAAQYFEPIAPVETAISRARKFMICGAIFAAGWATAAVTLAAMLGVW